MENFFYNDEFYDDIGSLMDAQDIDETMDGIDDQWEIECREGQLEPIVTLSVEWIMDRINPDRYTEDGDECHDIADLLEQYVNYEEINTQMPKLWYPTRKKFTITKQDLIDWCK